VRLERDDRGEYFLAYIEELPGVEADGTTEFAARASLASAFEDYLAAMLQWGKQIPEPRQWPESLGWDRTELGVEAGHVTVAAMVAVDVMASATAEPAFDGEIDALRFGQGVSSLETIAA
jgi:predicted RNase H-like HicB family nuclease